MGTINVPLDGSKAYSAPLVAGGVYRIVASGTYTQTGGGNPVERDALYCFHTAPDPFFECTPANPKRGPATIVRYEGDPSLLHDLDSLDPSSALPYNPLHTYQETFTAPSSSRLEVFNSNSQTYTYQGGIRLDLYRVSLPPAAGPGPGGPTAPATGPWRLPVAKKWNEPGWVTLLAPGGEAIAPGPEIASGQREASVTVSGDDSGKTGIVLSAPKPGKKLKRGDCVRAAAGTYKAYFEGSAVMSPGETFQDLREQSLLQAIYVLIGCLDYVNELDKQAASGAAASVVGGAARSSCRPSTVPLSLRVDRAAGTIAYSVRRASRRDPARRLRVSCRKTRNGTVTMHVRTRSRRTKLRKVLGKRLVVGLYLPRAAAHPTIVRTTFKRR